MITHANFFEISIFYLLILLLLIQLLLNFVNIKYQFLNLSESTYVFFDVEYCLF
jgi:hypothetical protein